MPLFYSCPVGIFIKQFSDYYYFFFYYGVKRDKSILISSLKCVKCQIFGTFDTPNTKTSPHQPFQISKNLKHIYSTVSNMRRYRHQCQTLFGLFNSFFLSPPSFVSLRLQPISLSLFLSGILIAISPRRETETAQARH